MKRWTAGIVFLTIALGISLPAFADEGLWLFNNFPVKAVKAKYGFTVTPEWLEHFRLSCVNFGGSASFVSADGLVITNHHVGARAIESVSTAGRDLIKDGFYARTKAEELKCPGLELMVLQDIEDVTPEVQAADKPGLSAAEAGRIRNEIISGIEKRASDKSGLRCQVVTLYAGGQFHLYKYKIFNDIRLVFAPEQQITFFGGDPDNYGYPRYCLDISFFRIYENGQPYKTPHHLKWNTSGLSEGELVFAAGNPMSTPRLKTIAQLEFLRDHDYPFENKSDLSQRDILERFITKGEEERRVGWMRLWGALNSIKCVNGLIGGLSDLSLMETKARNEKEIREAVRKNPSLEALYGRAWDEIAEAQKTYAEFHSAHQLFSRRQGFNTIYFTIARTIVRATADGRKADFGAFKERFFGRPIYKDLEIENLTASLSRLKELLPESQEVKWIMGNRRPEQAARELIAGTEMGDPEAVRKLMEGGRDAINLSNDSMIKLALLIDPISRALDERYRDKVQAVEIRNGALIARALFEIKGSSISPDATSTLRISYGQVKSYVEDGKKVPYQTNYKGLYERSAKYGNEFPFNLPERWLDGKSKVNMNAPFNFVATCDSSGGNSGSPLVNTKGEFVGILFDGNKQSMPSRFLYSDKQARSVMVHAGGILEALRSLYDARPLVEELTGK